jgi:hypothetical protein
MGSLIVRIGERVCHFARTQYNTRRVSSTAGRPIGGRQTLTRARNRAPGGLPEPEWLSGSRCRWRRLANRPSHSRGPAFATGARAVSRVAATLPPRRRGTGRSRAFHRKDPAPGREEKPGSPRGCPALVSAAPHQTRPAPSRRSERRAAKSPVRGRLRRTSRRSSGGATAFLSSRWIQAPSIVRIAACLPSARVTS